jgi:hypothetical protein
MKFQIKPMLPAYYFFRKVIHACNISFFYSATTAQSAILDCFQQAYTVVEHAERETVKGFRVTTATARRPAIFTH